MQKPVGTAQEGCDTQMPPHLSGDSSGFVQAVHRCRASPSPGPGLGWVRNHALIFSEEQEADADAALLAGGGCLSRVWGAGLCWRWSLPGALQGWRSGGTRIEGAGAGCEALPQFRV